MEHSTAAPPLMKDIAADEDHSTSSADHLRGLLEAIDTEDLEGVLAALRSLSKEEVDGVVPPLSMHALQIACTKETKNTMRDFIVELLLWHGASISVEGETTRLVELTFKAGNLATAAIVEQWKTDGQGKGPFSQLAKSLLLMSPQEQSNWIEEKRKEDAARLEEARRRDRSNLLAPLARRATGPLPDFTSGLPTSIEDRDPSEDSFGSSLTEQDEEDPFDFDLGTLPSGLSSQLSPSAPPFSFPSNSNSLPNIYPYPPPEHYACPTAHSVLIENLPGDLTRGELDQVLALAIAPRRIFAVDLQKSSRRVQWAIVNLYTATDCHHVARTLHCRPLRGWRLQVRVMPTGNNNHTSRGSERPQPPSMIPVLLPQSPQPQQIPIGSPYTVTPHYFLVAMPLQQPYYVPPVSAPHPPPAESPRSKRRGSWK